MKRLVNHFTYANVVATLALFLALAGGAAYAANQLGKNSVGTKQLKRGAVTKAKIQKATINSLRGAQGPAGPAGPPGPPGPAGGTLPAGVTLRGAFSIGRGEPATESFVSIRSSADFGGYGLSTRPVVNIVVQEQFPAVPAPPACPGSKANPEAAPGNLCVYVEVGPSVGGEFFVGDPTVPAGPGVNFKVDPKTFTVTGDGRASRFGFAMRRSVPVTAGIAAEGSWAVTG